MAHGPLLPEPRTYVRVGFRPPTIIEAVLNPPTPTHSVAFLRGFVCVPACHLQSHIGMLLVRGDTSLWKDERIIVIDRKSRSCCRCGGAWESKVDMCKRTRPSEPLQPKAHLSNNSTRRLALRVGVWSAWGVWQTHTRGSRSLPLSQKKRRRGRYDGPRSFFMPCPTPAHPPTHPSIHFLHYTITCTKPTCSSQSKASRVVPASPPLHPPTCTSPHRSMTRHAALPIHPHTHPPAPHPSTHTGERKRQQWT